MKQMTEQENLELQIKTYDSNYRAGTPLCTDAVYDKLYEELVSKFPDSELLKKGVVAQKISRKEKLPIPMYSLNKVKSVEEIEKWRKSKSLSPGTFIVITPKYDGISLVVEELVGNCWTRGDGEVGQKSNMHFAAMPHIGFSYQITTVGEAIISKKNWKSSFEGKNNPYSGDPYKNARNTVAGFFTPKEVREEFKFIDYIRYGSSNDDEDKNVQLVALNKLNTVQVPLRICQLKNIDKEMLDELYIHWSEEYQIDGLVIDICSAKIRKELGREENMNPAYAVAYKSPEWSGSAEVKVKGITWQVSKQGKLKPVINIEPTEVDGVVISNVTGINAAYVFDNNIAEDSVIKIIRSGSVIPKHIETLDFDGYECMLLHDSVATCPCCESPTKWDETMTELICHNPECKEKKIAKLVHFFTTLEVEEFGEPSIIRLYNAGFDTIERILKITIAQLLRIEGFATKSSWSLRNQFDKLIEVGKPLAQIVDACDLMEGKLGQKTIQLIFDNTDGPADWVGSDKLILIHGIADSSAVTFIAGMDEYWKKNLYDLPIKVTYIESPKVEVTGNKYENQKICFTGCRLTKEQEKEIQAQGGEVVSGVSGKTTLLVVKNTDDSTMSSSKAVKAKSLGIKIITLNNL